MAQIELKFGETTGLKYKKGFRGFRVEGLGGPVTD